MRCLRWLVYVGDKMSETSSNRKYDTLLVYLYYELQIWQTVVQYRLLKSLTTSTITLENKSVPKTGVLRSSHKARSPSTFFFVKIFVFENNIVNLVWFG